MNKFIFSIFILSSINTLWAQCAKKVDNSKVVFFVDTNYSDLEIATAQKAACERGQRLVVAPANYKEYTKRIQKLDQIKEEVKKNNCLIFSNAKNCSNILDRQNAANSELQQFTSTQPSVKSAVKNELEKLKNEKVSMESFIISGHDGGGNFGGYKGQFGRQDLNDMMKDYPEINQVQSLFLLGCYTGVAKETMEWQNIFPLTKFIAGYDGSAPLSTRPAGHEYLYDLLAKEKSLLKEKDISNIEAQIKGMVSGLGSLNAAMLIKPYCESPDDQKSFYYASKQDSGKFSELDIQKCLALKDEMATLRENYSRFYSGEVEPPTDTQNGELRQIYSKTRQNEHCGEITNIYIDPNQVLFLLFFEDVKKNFAKFYEKDLNKAEELIKAIKVDDILAELQKQQDKITLEITNESLLLEKMEKDPEGYIKEIKEVGERVAKEKKSLIEDPSYKKILEAAPYLKGENVSIGYTPASAIAALSENDQKKLQHLIELHYKEKNAEYDIQNFKNFPTSVASGARNILEAKKQSLRNMTLQVENLKKNPSISSQFWVPTKANLEGKSRKEILENIHNMNKVLYSSGLSKKEQATISWVNATASAHLNYLANPFDWHEFTGNPSKPPLSTSLEESQGAVVYPYSFGVGLAGGIGGGMVGGAGLGF